MTLAKVELRNVHMSFHADGRVVHALNDVSLEVREGEFVAIVGPSGSGKSTLFNLIVGLLEPESGEILLDGKPRTDRVGLFGYMPQRDLLLPWRTVLGNAILPLQLRGVAVERAASRARAMLPLFGLEEFAQSLPAALSGGMRQRAALLRTILTEREVLLLDEPFGALDALTRRELQDWLLRVWKEFGHTIVFITHDVEEAVYLSDRVLVLSARPGQVLMQAEVNLPRPRRQGMVAEPEFGRQVASLLDSLGVRV